MGGWVCPAVDQTLVLPLQSISLELLEGEEVDASSELESLSSSEDGASPFSSIGLAGAAETARRAA